MSGPITSLGTNATPPVPGDAKLHKAARQLEGVFTQQLFKAMRETVPEDQGVVGGGSAQDMFTGLLDEHLATDPRASSTHGVGEAIYRHLLRTRAMHGTSLDAPATTPATGGAPSVTGPSARASSPTVP